MTRLTPAAIISSSAALANLLSAPAALSAQSPKRRYSDTSDGSDGYYDRSRKSPRPNPYDSTPLRPPPIPQASPTAAPGSDQSQRQQQPQQQSAAQPGRHAQARMRSSIACVRCRRSKVKCVNSGVGTPCRSCEASGRDCTYPVPVTGGRRREGSLSGPVQRPEGLGDVEVGGRKQMLEQIDTNPHLAGEETTTASQKFRRPTWTTNPYSGRARFSSSECPGCRTPHTVCMARIGQFRFHVVRFASNHRIV